MELIQLAGDAWVIPQGTLALTSKVTFPAAAVGVRLVGEADNMRADCRRLGEGNAYRFGRAYTGGSERKECLSGGSLGIYFVCDGNFLISASRFVRNGGNPSIRRLFW